jgi:heme exporter protein CcmD
MNQWASFDAWLAMGGYAVYVWSSVVLALGTLLANLVFAKRRHAAALQRALRRATMNGTGEK